MDGHEGLREKLADLLAFLIVLTFIVAMIVGMIDHTYQPPPILQAAMGIVGTFLFGQRFLPAKPKGDTRDEVTQDSSRSQSTDKRDDNSVSNNAGIG